MKRKSFLFVTMLALVASLFYATPSNASENLQGAGSSFAANFIDRCRIEYAKTEGGSIGYNAIGSGSGKNMFQNAVVDFAMSDVPYSAAEINPSKPFIYAPVVAGPIGIIYKLDGYRITLKMTKDTLAKVFAGQITMWNDPQILNENLIAGKLPKIPATKIRIVYRLDGSGTSEVFTSYLNAVAPTIWTKPGNKNFLNAFPTDATSVYMNGASGSSGVAMIQGTTNGSIAYNEISYARGLKTISVENGAGRFVQPTVNAAASFLSDFVASPNGTIKPNYNNKNLLAYNISTFTYGISYTEASPKTAEVKKFFNFMLDVCGKKANDLGYSPIKGNALKLAKAQIAKIK